MVDLDGTGESSDEIVFMAKDGITEITTDPVICHYNFVRELGKDVFSSYAELRGSMVSTNGLAVISGIELTRNKTGDRDELIYAEETWIAVAAEYALGPRILPSKFLFVLPYLEVLERCMEIEGMLKFIIG